MNKFSFKAYHVRLFLVSVSLILSNLGSNVSALSEAHLDMYNRNGIYYYDPDDDAPNYEKCQTPAGEKPSGDKVTWIGDSYSVGAEWQQKLISNKLPGVDLGGYDNTADPPADSYIKGSKTAFYNLADNPSGISILEDTAGVGKLRPYLIFALGTNTDTENPSKAAGFMQDAVNEVLRIAGSDTTIIFVTSYTLQYDYAAPNQVLKTAADNNSNVYLADWAAIADDSWYASDPSGVHPFSAYDKWVDLIYDTIPGSTSKGTGQLINTSSLPQETIDFLDNANVKEMAENNMERYKYAADNTGLPWQAIAALHFMEGGMRSDASISNGQEFGSSDYTNIDGLTIYSDPNMDTLEHAKDFINTVKNVYGIDLAADQSIDAFGKAFLAYNRGYMYKATGNTWDESPYVAAGLDASHPISMQFIYADSYYNGQQLNNLAGTYTSRPGALAVMAYLGSDELNRSSACVSVGSEISDGGLTVEQAKLLAMNYGDNKNNYPSSVMTLWHSCGDAYGNDWGGSNCVSFSEFFVNAFTDYKFPIANGNAVVPNFSLLNPSVQTGTEPRPFSVFSISSGTYGHTGVLVGIHDGKYILVQASCPRGQRGIRGKGDGTEEGGGSAWVVTEVDDDPANWSGIYSNSTITFAYLTDIDTAKLKEFINGTLQP